MGVDVDRVPGDIFEAGIWRGGAVMWAKAVLEAHRGAGEISPKSGILLPRRVWAADSFQGLPSRGFVPGMSDVVEALWYRLNWMRVSKESVSTYLSLYGLLDDGVIFV